MPVIRRSLARAFVHHLASIPVAAFRLLALLGGPMLPAATMARSSVSVDTSSLRLRRVGLGSRGALAEMFLHGVSRGRTAAAPPAAPRRQLIHMA